MCENEWTDGPNECVNRRLWFLRVLTVYRDALWDVAASQPSRPRLTPNEGYLADAVVPLGAAGDFDMEDHEDDDDDDDEDEDEVDGEDGVTAEDGGGGGGGGGGEALDGVGDGRNGENEEERRTRLNEEMKESGGSEGGVGGAGDSDSTQPPQQRERQQRQPTQDEMDDLIDRSVLQALRTGVKDKALPLLGSVFWAQHVVPGQGTCVEP